MGRYLIRYAGKQGFEERYEVADARTQEALSPPRRLTTKQEKRSLGGN